jgi:DNA-binding transcriptional MerR regulator
VLRIGEFAWLGQVTVETLRHYDRIGLLKPVHLDRFTGYRYYSLDQLPRLNRVLALKDLGLPLKEIVRMLDRDVSADEIRGILEIKETELMEQIQEARKRLARVETRLRQIVLEGKMPEYEVLLKTVDAQWIASVRETISSWDQDVVGPTMSRMFEEVEEHLCSRGAKIGGPGISLWHQRQLTPKSSEEDEAIDVEIAAPIDGPVEEGDRVKVRKLPKMEVAYTVNHGSFSGLPPAKQAVFSWIEENGYRLVGPVREVYLHFDPHPQVNADSPHHVTEVQFPVEKG